MNVPESVCHLLVPACRARLWCADSLARSGATKGTSAQLPRWTLSQTSVSLPLIFTCCAVSS